MVVCEGRDGSSNSARLVRLMGRKRIEGPWGFRQGRHALESIKKKEAYLGFPFFFWWFFFPFAYLFFLLYGWLLSSAEFRRRLNKRGVMLGRACRGKRGPLEFCPW